jgi:cardiolipin synthase
LRLLRRIRRRVDTRNHRKIAVIDGEIAYIGSHNLCEPSYGRRDMVWHDVSARLQGPTAAHLEALFLSDWSAESAQLPPLDEILARMGIAGNSWLHVLPSGPIYPRENYQRLIASAIHRAHQKVILTTPYFVPDEDKLQAMENACLRGVEITVVLPAKTDQKLPGFAARSYYEEILGYGVQLYLYEDALLHAKTVTVDDRMAFLGSGNVDIRSFALNFEATLVCYTTDDVERLSDIQRTYIAHSKRLTPDEWAKRGPSIRVVENLVRLLGPLL